MTVQEAIKNCKIFTNIYDLFEEDKLSIDTLIEFAEKADKYRWHDLRESPEDLPPDTGDLCEVVYDGGLYALTYCSIARSDISIYVAWRLHEPSEVEE